jgi:hypothetical protein
MAGTGWRYLLPLLLLPALLYPVRTLEVKTRESDRLMLLERVRPGDEFRFEYTHSVEKIPVSGRFRITPEDTIQAVETVFPSFGPGLPFLKDEVVIADGAMRSRTPIPSMQEFSFLVSSIAAQRLILGAQRLEFSALRDGEAVTVRVRKTPYLEAMFRHGQP